MFNKINYLDIVDNSIKLFKEDFPIVVFGNMEKHNGMTIGWGSLGCIWKKPLATVYVKPNRYSFKFAEECKYFSIMWFDQNIRDDINKVFGYMSGRDVDKEKLCNLTPIILDNAVCYEEAKRIIVCKKIYQNKIDPNNILSLEVRNRKMYEDGLFHSEFFGEIISVYQK